MPNKNYYSSYRVIDILKSDLDEIINIQSKNDDFSYFFYT